MKKLFFTLIAILFVAFTYAEGWRPGEMEIKVEISSKQDAALLSSLRLNGDYFIDNAILYVVPAELEQLKAAGLTYEILKEDLNAYYADFWETRDAYHSYQEIIDLADSLAEHFPNICTKHVFGTSLGGRQLAALKISDNPETDENEPEVMFDAGIHGDEIGGPENVIRFARKLCLEYGTDPEITDLIDNREIWLYLMVNPDGRVNMVRTNNNGVDLNRDWGYMWDGWGSSTGAFSQPESKALRSCSYFNQFVVHTTYHSGTEYISCPWSYRSSAPYDASRILQLAGVYSSVSGYSNLEYGQGNTGMYAINGSTKDSNYGAMGSISWSMEISYSKQPPASQIMTYFNYNVPSMLAMIEYSGYGIQGTITDAVTGDPVSAAIFVNNYLPCFTDPEVGDYHKYLLPGTYSIMVKANGYDDKLVNDVVVVENSATTINIALDPLDQTSVYRVISCRIPDNNEADPGITWNVIGQPDNLYYSIGKNGWIVVDMGEIIFDGAGPDLMVFEGDAGAEGYTLYAGETMDGPFYEMGQGNGTSEFDLSICTISEARYFKIKDDGDGSANVNGAGFDFDAMQALSSVTGPYLIMDGYVIDDSNGNNNGQLDPGETVEYTITLKNVGSEEALDIMGTLSCNDQYVTVITTEPQSYGNIAINASAEATYTVSAAESAPAGYSAMLELEYEGSNVSPATKYIEVLFPDYCYPTANCSYGDGFTGFALEDISNMNSGCSNNGYGDFTDMSTALEAGQQYTVSWETGYSNQDASLWIDLNADMIFDESERLITDYNLANSGQVYTVDFTVPDNVTPGEKRLRIRANWQNSSADPCANFSYGETEDYTVIIGGGAPSAAFTADVTELCHGDQVQFTDNSTGNITTWEWTFEGGTPATSTEQNPVVTYDTPGTWDVSLTVGDGTTTNTASTADYIMVYDDPATPDMPDGDTELCSNSPNSTYTTNNISGATGWIWEINPEDAGTLTPNGTSVVVNWNDDFSGDVQLTVACENLCGQSDMSDPLDITVLPLPDQAGSIGGDDEVCQEQVAIYTVDPIANADDYIWTLDPEEAGTMAVDQNECTVTWSDSYEGDATLFVQGTNECGEGPSSPAFDVIVFNCTGIFPGQTAGDFTVYPNPGNGLFTVDFGNTEPETCTITVVNLLGSVVYTRDINDNISSMKMDLSNLPDGVYYMQISNNAFTATKKIVIRK